MEPMPPTRRPGLRTPAARPSVTEGYDCYWVFAAERQQVYYRRLAGLSGPLTGDPVLAAHRFTNPYRASDRVSQYLINEVQYDREWDWPDTFARTMIFKIFNRIDTWEHVRSHAGEPDLAKLLDGSVDDALAAIVGRRPVYTAAYMMPPPVSFPGPKYARHLELIRTMVRDGAPGEIRSAETMDEAFAALRRYDSIGDFLAYQFITDLNYSPHLGFSETEFVVPGPGARRGIRKCFTNSGDFGDDYLIRWTYERQEREFADRGLPWAGLAGRPLQYIDIQNLFCEVDKYTRLAVPELSRYAPGTRIKQRYKPAPGPLTAVFPPKWGLTEMGAGRPAESYVPPQQSLGF